MESIILLVFVLWGCFNFRWVGGDAVRQKFLFRVSCNGIFCVSPRLKSRSARRASRHIAFMVLFFHSCCYSRK